MGLADQVYLELERLGAYYSYGARDGFVVFENSRKETIIYQEGFEVIANNAVVEALKGLPDGAGAGAVYDALGPFTKEGER